MRYALITLILTAVPAIAQEPVTGEELYRAYCAGCHGVSASGDGALADLLTVPVADLTGLAARNDGVFPLSDVVQTIDGRMLLDAHGGPMPVFGPMLGGGSAVIDAPEGGVIQTRGDVLKIAEYLASQQAE
ncbi:c-type cytochrome [Pseudoruegeria sp. HB172150]|uniref:c-type cytochrome n=1 Tax=Pseudoruegeria sp. HB172150 TaxID=2721164 RepID=UPI0015536872|nr:c-type cytochrome [Pseudoruegeria sp. HB172150]